MARGRAPRHVHGALLERFGTVSFSDLPPKWSNFRGLVLGCIDTSDSESRRIIQHFSRSTRFVFLCTATKSEVYEMFVNIFAKSKYLAENSQNRNQNQRFFIPKFMKFHLNFAKFSHNFSKVLQLVARIFKIHEC